MKRIFLVMVAVLGLLSCAVAQTFTFPVGTSAKGDTVQNTGTIYKPITLQKVYSAGSIQVVNTKVSGTVAGTSILQYSVDGTNWKTFDAVGDTLTNTNTTTNSHIWDLNPVLYPYYRVVTTGSGTMVALTRAYAYLKRD